MNHKLPLLLLFAAACSSGPPYDALMIEDDAVLVSNVKVTDGELRDVVRVGRAAVERVSGSNQLKVMVSIRNIDIEPIEVLVQVSFLDGRKMPIGDDTNQQVKVISPGMELPLVVLSKFETAQDWKMTISWNR
jgi:hypothetical protein